jgi:hypothetical protein
MAALDLPIRLNHSDYEVGLSGLVVPEGDLIVVFVAPPWGTG